MRNVNSILALLKREFLVTFRNLSDILSIVLFFLLGIIIFVFSVGPNKEIINEISVGIIWALILLSNTLSSPKFFQSDFDDNSIILFFISGISYEVIVILKVIIFWLCLQIPFLFAILLSMILLNIEFVNVKIIFLSFLLGTPTITCISSISGSMNLLNNRNFAIGSLIIMILSIPVIIFSISIIDSPQNIIDAQINILLGIMLFFISITPWICAACIKLGIQNK